MDKANPSHVAGSKDDDMDHLPPVACVPSEYQLNTLNNNHSLIPAVQKYEEELKKFQQKK